MTRRHLGFMLLINLIWGFNIVPFKLVLEHIPPVTATLCRFVMLAILCAPALRWRESQMLPITLVGLINGAVHFSLMIIAFSIATNVPAIVIAGQLAVPFSLLLAVIFLGERIRAWRISGVVLAFAGVVIVGFDPAVLHEGKALIIAAAGTFCYAVSIVMMRQLRGVGPLTLQAWIGLLSVPPLVGLSMLFEPGAIAQLAQTPLVAFGYLFINAAGSSMIGQAGYYYLLQRYPVTVTAPYTLLSPVISVAAASWLLDSPLTAQVVAGGLITLAGVAIITVRSARRATEEHA